MSDFIYLASQSPRRSQLLAQLGVAHRLLLPEPAQDSDALEQALPHELPTPYVQRVTLLKLHAALARRRMRALPEALVLCADTTVALGRTIYGKPRDAAHAARMLTELSGRTHRVLTAVAVGNEREQRLQLSTSRVRFAHLSAREIRDYASSAEPLDKAGAYAVQGRAAAFIAQVGGSYSGIMGLPLYETAQLLKSMGFRV